MILPGIYRVFLLGQLLAVSICCIGLAESGAASADTPTAVEASGETAAASHEGGGKEGEDKSLGV